MRLSFILKPLLISSILVLISCEEFLTEKPHDFISSENFFSSAKDAESSVNAIYDGFRRVYSWPEYLTALEIRGDYAKGRASWVPFDVYDQSLDANNFARASNPFNIFYKVIANANTSLTHIPGIDMDDVEKNALLGQARFLRALAYFHLVRAYGAVPLRLEEITGIGALPAPRASLDEVYSTIVDDLLFAEVNCRESEPQVGRATKWAAKTLLADVYLTIGEFALARDKSKEVIDSDFFSLVPVSKASDFDEKIFGPNVINSTEEIFYVKFSNVNPFGSALPLFFTTGKEGYGLGGYWVINGVTKSPVVTQWSDLDLRKAFTIYTQYVDVNTGQTVQVPQSDGFYYAKFKDPSATARDNHSMDFPVYRLSDAMLLFAEASAMAEGGPSAAAYEQANRVRRRAFGKDIYTPSDVDLPPGMSAGMFRDAILIERAWEFMSEGKRWYDLLRTGKAKSTIMDLGYAWDDRAYLFPLPQNELDTNAALTQADQNPGY